MSPGENLQQTYEYLAANNITNASYLYPKSKLFELKAVENDKRREAISKVCAGMNSAAKELMEYNIEDVILSKKNMIAYCSVPKIHGHISF